MTLYYDPRVDRPDLTRLIRQTVRRRELRVTVGECADGCWNAELSLKGEVVARTPAHRYAGRQPNPETLVKELLTDLDEDLK